MFWIGQLVQRVVLAADAGGGVPHSCVVCEFEAVTAGRTVGMVSGRRSEAVR